MPIQLVVESICALSLVILVLRVSFMIIATLLFGLLTYVESVCQQHGPWRLHLSRLGRGNYCLRL